MIGRRNILTIAITVGGMIGGSMAGAASSEGRSTAPMEEIVVTAQKREQNLQTVPISMQAFTGSQLEQLNVDRSADISALTPGLHAQGSRGDQNPIFAIRGIGLNDLFTNNNPTVGVYLDGVVQPYTPMLGFQLFDIERVEVLKGPQGTLYGRNTTGGAVNFVTREPTFEPSGYVDFSYGRFERADLEGAYSTALSDTVAFRVSAKTTQQNDGWQTNTLTGETIGDKDRTAVRAQLAFEPSQTFDALAKVSFLEEESDQQLRQHVGFLDQPFSFTPCDGFLRGERDEQSCVDFIGYSDPNTDPRKVENSAVFGHEVDADAWDLSLTMNWRLPDFTVTSVTGYSNFDRAAGDDSDGGGLIELDTLFTDDIQVFSQELRVSSPDNSKHDWVVGTFFYDDDFDGGALQALDEHIFQTRVNTVFTQESRAAAVFGQADWHLSHRMRVTTGLRYTWEEKSFKYNSFDLDPFGTSAGLPTPVAGIDDEFSENDVSGKLGIDYDITDTVMAYASASKGFKSGGYKAAIAFNPAELEPFEGENLYAYELGVKSTLLDGRLRLNAAGYYYDWKDFQAFVTEIRGGINVIVLSNAGDAESYGAEAEIQFQATDRLSLRSAINVMETEITEFNAAPGAEDNTGNQLSYAPDVSFSGILRYDFPVEQHGFNMYFSLDTSYKDRVYYSLANRKQNSQEAYWLTNARIGVTSPDEKLELTLWGRNLSDELYITQSYDNFGGIFPSQNYLGDPRTYGISLRYRM